MYLDIKHFKCLSNGVLDGLTGSYNNSYTYLQFTLYLQMDLFTADIKSGHFHY